MREFTCWDVENDPDAESARTIASACFEYAALQFARDRHRDLQENERHVVRVRGQLLNTDDGTFSEAVLEYTINVVPDIRFVTAAPTRIK